MKGDRDRCLAAGMNAYVSKPFTAADLIGALAELFGTEPQGGVAGKRTPTPPDTAVFDRTALMNHADGDAALARKMAACFLEDATARLAGLEEAAQVSDSEAFARHAHTLKGAAAKLDGCRAQQACLRLETAVLEGDIQAAKAMIAEAKREVGALAQALREFLES